MQTVGLLISRRAQVFQDTQYLQSSIHTYTE